MLPPLEAGFEAAVFAAVVFGLAVFEAVLPVSSRKSEGFRGEPNQINRD
jgi:hypothetical protein